MKLTKPGQKNMVFFLAISRLGFTSVVHVVFNALCWFIYLKKRANYQHPAVSAFAICWHAYAYRMRRENQP